jgi:hypothetical protein
MTFIIAILAIILGAILIERHLPKIGKGSILVPVRRDDHPAYRHNDKYRR